VLPPTISFISHRRLSSYPTQKEMIDTNFAVKCVLHVENLFAADMLSQESSVQRQLHIERNVSLRIQYWLLSCTVRRKWQKKTAWGNAAVRKALLARAIATTLRCKGGWKSVPSMDYTIPMEIEKVQPSLWPRGLNPASTPRVRASSKFILLDDPKDIWFCLTSFSNFVSSQGKHGAYFLNERRQFKVFWARTVLENGEDPEVHLTTMPSFNNKRFEIQSELAFHVCSYFNGVMKYIRHPPERPRLRSKPTARQYIQPL